MDEIIEHIYKIDIGRNGPKGGHHWNAFRRDRENIKILKWTALGKGFYHVDYKFFNQNAFDLAKNRYERWKIRPKNKNKQFEFSDGNKTITLGNDISKWKQNDYFWKKKKNGSTLFPDNWSGEEIKKAIVEAYDNNGRGLVKKYDRELDQYVKSGQTKDGIWIQFYLENTPSSAFPNFNLE